MSLFNPSTLFFASAAFTALTIPKHVSVGFEKIYPAVDAIPSRPELSLAKNIINTTWDFANFSLIAMSKSTNDSHAILNLKWARAGGASTMEDRLVIWANLVAGAVVGLQYYRSSMYAALGVLWGAPVLSVAAMLWPSA